MVVHDAGGCHSDRDTVSSHFCQGSFNQRLRGDGRSLKDLLSALGSIGVDPRLLQNAARRIGGCYGDPWAAGINCDYKDVWTFIMRVILRNVVIFFLIRRPACDSFSTSWFPDFFLNF